MTRLEGRVGRLESAFHKTVPDEEATLLRRIEAVVGLIPTAALRLLLAAGAAHADGRALNAAQRAAEVALAQLLESGAWGG